jgi:hypothetical protein
LLAGFAFDFAFDALRFGDFFLVGDFLAADFLALPFFFGERFFEAGLAALRFFAIADGSFNRQRPRHRSLSLSRGRCRREKTSQPRENRCGAASQTCPLASPARALFQVAAIRVKANLRKIAASG